MRPSLLRCLLGAEKGRGLCPPWQLSALWDCCHMKPAQPVAGPRVPLPSTENQIYPPLWLQAPCPLALLTPRATPAPTVRAVCLSPTHDWCL